MARAEGPRQQDAPSVPIAGGITRLPPGPLGRALSPLTPIQRAVVMAAIIGRPRALRRIR